MDPITERIEGRRQATDPIIWLLFVFYEMKHMNRYTCLCFGVKSIDPFKSPKKLAALDVEQKRYKEELRKLILKKDCCNKIYHFLEFDGEISEKLDEYYCAMTLKKM